MEGAKTGIQLNIGKCQAISTAPFKPASTLAGFSTTLPSDAVLLGAPLLGLGLATDRVLEARCSNLRTAIIRLKAIYVHDALILLRFSFSAPRLLHILRCTPCGLHPLQGTHDDLLRGVISAICNTNLGDLQWIQVSLPVREGGLESGVLLR